MWEFHSLHLRNSAKVTVTLHLFQGPLNLVGDMPEGHILR
jgi:hypothetical protein